MSQQPILVESTHDKAPKRPDQLSPSPEAAWRILGVVGAFFGSVALLDILLAWYPANFASQEWAFGTITATLNSLPLFSLGLMLALGAALARGNLLASRVAVGFLAASGGFLVALGIVYLTTVSAAFQVVVNPIRRIGLRKAMFRTETEAIVYSAAYLWVAVRAWRHIGIASPTPNAPAEAAAESTITPAEVPPG